MTFDEQQNQTTNPENTPAPREVGTASPARSGAENYLKFFLVLLAGLLLACVLYIYYTSRTGPAVEPTGVETPGTQESAEEQFDETKVDELFEAVQAEVSFSPSEDGEAATQEAGPRSDDELMQAAAASTTADDEVDTEPAPETTPADAEPDSDALFNQVRARSTAEAEE